MQLRIAYKKRGTPPPCPEGYEQEPGDPYSFTLKWLPCIFHGLDNGKHMCAMYIERINQNDCAKCGTRCVPESPTG